MTNTCKQDIEHALPLKAKAPNTTTSKTLEDADKGLGLHTAKDVDDLFKQLNH